MTVNLAPESGTAGTEFKVEVSGYIAYEPISIELIQPDPCGSVIEKREARTMPDGYIRQSFTVLPVSPLPRDFNPCLYGVYKVVFTTADKGVLKINLTVLEHAS